MLPAADILCVDQIVVHHLHSPIPDVVHPLYPLHLILGLDLFGDALTDSHLLYQLKKHGLCLIVQIGKITVQLAGDLQLCVQRLSMLTEIPQMPLPSKKDLTRALAGALDVSPLALDVPDIDSYFGLMHNRDQGRRSPIPH